MSKLPSSAKKLPQLHYPALAVLAVAGLILAACSGGPGGPIQEHPHLQDRTDQLESVGSDHASIGTEIRYPTTPPFGGTHWEVPARCGIYNEAQRFEGLVHTMEHGAIIWYYDPAQWTAADIEQFGALSRELLDDGKRIVLAPVSVDYPLAKPIALAAWGYILFLDEFETDSIRSFVNEFENEGPENLPRDTAC